MVLSIVFFIIVLHCHTILFDSSIFYCYANM